MKELLPLFVLDDDPTGAQAVRDVPVVFAWSSSTLSQVLARRPRAIHLVTNSRAFDARRAAELTGGAAAAALAASPGSRVVLRGDSTLRGHVFEEYAALCAVLGSDGPPVLLLVPALPAAGRVTRGGVHLLVRDGRAVPLHDTEYASDGAFKYRSAHLLEWADERSSGVLASRDGETVGLDRLHRVGPESVAEAILAAGRHGRPAVVAPDAESLDDLGNIAAGLELAEAAGAKVVVRCAPAFVGVLAGSLATDFVAPPPVHDSVLVVAGSYVPGTTRQLAHVRSELGIESIVLDPEVLAGPVDRAVEAVAVAASQTNRALMECGVAVIATSRVRPASTRNLTAGMTIARRLAGIIPALGREVDVLIAKGGITSAMTLTDGVGVDHAWVRGPMMPGVSLWQAERPRGPMAYVVVPGNVGDDSLLSDLIRRLVSA